MLCKILLQRVKVLSEHRNIRNFLEMRADQAVRGERVAQAKLSEAEDHTRRHLEEQKDYLLIEAQSELYKQELRVHCADRALHESGMQLPSQRMELYQANQSTEQSHREKRWLSTEFEMRDRALQEDRTKSCHENRSVEKDVLYRS